MFNLSPSHSRVEWRLYLLSLQRRIIWLGEKWHTFYRTRPLLPLLPLYQICQGTRVHSRPTSWISYRLGSTSLHCHCHSLSLACRVLITAAAAAHSPWVVRSANGNNGQRHRAAATPATGGGGNDNGQRQQAAATMAVGSGVYGNGQRQRVLFCSKLPTLLILNIHIHNILILATVVHLPRN